MSTDRELLELAAKAAGIVGLTWRNGSQCFYFDDPETGRELWDPLQRDGQALRLFVKLGMGTKVMCLSTGCGRTLCEFLPVDFEGDPAAATRRAIVLAAADIGKAMP
jgi:hypothetical protein